MGCALSAGLLFFQISAGMSLLQVVTTYRALLIVPHVVCCTHKHKPEREMVWCLYLCTALFNQACFLRAKAVGNKNAPQGLSGSMFSMDSCLLFETYSPTSSICTGVRALNTTP